MHTDRELSSVKNRTWKKMEEERIFGLNLVLICSLLLSSCTGMECSFRFTLTFMTRIVYANDDYLVSFCIFGIVLSNFSLI